jgi:hypothetical protein
VKQPILFLTTRPLCYSRFVNTSLVNKILLYSLVFVFWPGISSPRVLVSRRPPHYLSFFTIVNSTLWFKYCPQHAAHGLVPPFANPAFVILYGLEAYSSCTSGYPHRPTFQYAASAASAASSSSPPFAILHHSSANAIPHGAPAFELRLAPGQRVPNSAHRHFRSFSRKICFFLYSGTATGHLSNSASSVVPVLCVPACRHSFPPAKRRASLSSIPTSLSRSTRVSRQHTVRLGRLSALPDPATDLASSCFPWPLPVAAHRLPKLSCRMPPMEQSRRVAVDNLVSSVSLAAYPRTG